jgi:hypothetical protein
MSKWLDNQDKLFYSGSIVGTMWGKSTTLESQHELTDYNKNKL